jgi:hypothetical protein
MDGGGKKPDVASNLVSDCRTNLDFFLWALEVFQYLLVPDEPQVYVHHSCSIIPVNVFREAFSRAFRIRGNRPFDEVREICTRGYSGSANKRPINPLVHSSKKERIATSF